MTTSRPDSRKKYGVKLKRTPPLRLGMHPDSASYGNYRSWLKSQDGPLAIDLFSGAGGLSLGLEQAGYAVALAVDTDQWALETHAHNFRGLALDLDLACELVREQLAGIFKGIEVDLVAGGPPCQPYSRAGKSKIRSLVATGAREADDERRELWRAFLDVVKRVRPNAVLMENVPDMALGDGAGVLREILGKLESFGYATDARLLDAWLYGVPQHRQRLVLVGVRDGRTFQWPSTVQKVTVREAISDLPALDSDPRLAELGGRELPYAGPMSAFQQRARDGCEAQAEIVLDHSTRAVRVDDLKAFKLMKPGTLYSELPARLRRYRADIFDDKYNRLRWDDLSRSITAHIAKDGYWYIHPAQHRTITVREAARIQTFPDRFRFAGTRSKQFAQIGNAVPPALAEAVGGALLMGRGREMIGSNNGIPETAWRREIWHALVRWGTKDAAEVPWLYPGEFWPALVGQLIREGPGFPGPADVLEILPSLASADQDSLSRLSRRSTPGVRRRNVQRLKRAVRAVSADQENWRGEKWMDQAEISPAERMWLRLLTEGGGMVGSAGVLRVVARITGTSVDRKNAHSHGSIELAKLLGDLNPAFMNATLARLSKTLCRNQVPECSKCPLVALCPGSLVALPVRSRQASSIPEAAESVSECSHTLITIHPAS